jgi:dihydroflavonol-4-reductase
MLQKNLAISTVKKEQIHSILSRLSLSFSYKMASTAFPFIRKTSLLVVVFFLFFSSIFAQKIQAFSDSTKVTVSVETDPAFWVGTLPNGLGFDANFDFIIPKMPHLRFGILACSGKWSGSFGKTVLLTNDFNENNWVTQWNGLGIEMQYIFRLGLKRGGLQPGLRLQWNQFQYNQKALKKGEANHFVITPQVGFQWFPFKNLGLYLLPWAGVQVPIRGTDKIVIDGQEKNTRKLMPVVTAHIGWAFHF